ncbi:MAG: DNA-binding protein [Pseudonocardiaceae bacterium]|nr:DNA-binding protein [Pseudonocardiaceae bacterium]
MSDVPAAADVLDSDVEVLTLAEVGRLLGLGPSRVHQMLRDGQLLALRRDDEVVVPTVFLAPGEEAAVVKGLVGTVTLLRDAGYADEEILRWLFTEDETLPGSPIEALRSNRGREVKRRAQAMGF